MDDEAPQPPASPSPATFKGRLALQEFMFQAKSTASTMVPKDGISPMALRRSPRHLTPVITTSPSPSPSPSTSRSHSSLGPSRSASSSTTKRKAPRDDNEDDNAAPPPLSSTPSPPPSSSKKKRSRPPSTYAPPSVYAHLPPLPDAIAPNLLVLFVGLNPGIQTSRQQHAYAHPSNLFWKLLASSGITPRLVAASEDRTLPQDYGLGLTNIVSRPSRNGAELSKAEMDAGVAVLEEKARRWRPEVCCVVGKSIWESIWRVRHGRAIRKEEFRYGWQEEAENMGKVGEEGMRDEEREEGVDYGDAGGKGEWKGSRVFVSCSTSGLAATLRPPEKEAIFKELGDWVKQRRESRNAPCGY